MTTILMRHVKSFGKFSDSIFLKKRDVQNIVFGQFNNQHQLSRKILLTIKDTENDDEAHNVCTDFEEVYDNLRKQKWIDKSVIERLIKGIKTADNVHSNEILLILKSHNKIVDCLPLERVKLMEYLWSVSYVCDIPVNIYHYNALLEIYLENDYDFSPTQLLIEMKDKQIQPNSNIYEKCIEYFCKKGAVSEALKLINDMKHLGLYINGTVYNSLIMGYSQFGNIGNINKILIDMKQKNFKPTLETYIAALNGYTKLNISKIHEVINSNSGVVLISNVNILQIIYVLLKNNYTEDVETMYKYIKRQLSLSTNEVKYIQKFLIMQHVNVATNVLLRILPDRYDSREYETFLEFVLQIAVNSCSDVQTIVRFCDFLQNDNLYVNPLLKALYYSYFRQDDQMCLPLLRVCSTRYTIKPQFFWPIFIKKAENYDFQGILNLLKIMNNEFNATPCVHTLMDYVIPFTFGTVDSIRQHLLMYNVNETTLNNAFVVSFLNLNKLQKALSYMNKYPGLYFYDTIGFYLRKAFISRRDVQKFIQISLKLVEYRSTNNDSKSIVFVPLENQLFDFRGSGSAYKLLLVKVIYYLFHEKIQISTEAAREICNFLNEHATNDVKLALTKLSRKVY